MFEDIYGVHVPSLARGFQLEQVDFNVPGTATKLNALREAFLPQGVFFQSLAECQELCQRVGVAGSWGGTDLKLGLRPPTVELASWVRSEQVLMNAMTTCPQAALRVLLLYLRAAFEDQSGADTAEAGRAHLRYVFIKKWLLEAVFPVEEEKEVLKGWELEDEEQQVLQTMWQTKLAPLAPGPGPAGFVTRRAEGFYTACPEASNMEAEHELRAWMRHPSSPSSSLTGTSNDTTAPLADLIEGPLPVGMFLIGNALSLYWQARGAALLAGAAFASSNGISSRGSFAWHLPRAAPAQASAMDALALSQACAACPSEQDWRYPHRCLGPWAAEATLRELRRGTLEALRGSGAQAAAATRLKAWDVVIHFRCFPYWRSAYPLAGFSLYDALDPAFAETAGKELRFLIVAGHLGPTCEAVVAALETRLRLRHPRAFVLRLFGLAPEGVKSEALAKDAEAEVDFATLVQAPVLFRTPGSFSLWAALARETAEEIGRQEERQVVQRLVFSAPNPVSPGSGWLWREADFGANWRWVQVPLLVPEVVERHGFTFENPGPWIEWLESH